MTLLFFVRKRADRETVLAPPPLCPHSRHMRGWCGVNESSPSCAMCSFLSCCLMRSPLTPCPISLAGKCVRACVCVCVCVCVLVTCERAGTTAGHFLCPAPITARATPPHLLVWQSCHPRQPLSHRHIVFLFQLNLHALLVVSRRTPRAVSLTSTPPVLLKESFFLRHVAFHHSSPVFLNRHNAHTRVGHCLVLFKSLYYV